MKMCVWRSAARRNGASTGNPPRPRAIHVSIIHSKAYTAGGTAGGKKSARAAARGSGARGLARGGSAEQARRGNAFDRFSLFGSSLRLSLSVSLWLGVGRSGTLLCSYRLASAGITRAGACARVYARARGQKDARRIFQRRAGLVVWRGYQQAQASMLYSCAERSSAPPSPSRRESTRARSAAAASVSIAS